MPRPVNYDLFDDFIRGSYPNPIYNADPLGRWQAVPIIAGSPIWYVSGPGQASNTSDGAECVTVEQEGPNVDWTVKFQGPPSFGTFSAGIYFALWPVLRSQPANGGDTFPANGAYGVGLIAGLGGVTNQWNFRRYNGGAGTIISDTVPQAVAAGDEVRVRVEDDTYSMFYRAAGATDWTLVTSCTESLFSGLPGHLAMEASGVALTEIRGGTLVDAPLPPSNRLRMLV
jgi:hypothetical protein